MFKLEGSKEIIIKPNKDKTYNMTVKYDMYDPKGEEIVKEVKIKYPKVEIKNFNINVLATDGKYGEVLA